MPAARSLRKRKQFINSGTNTPTKKHKPTTTSTQVIQLNTKLKQTVLEQLTCRTTPPKLIGLHKQYKEIHKLISNCIKYKESKSSLVIGPRGVGKTCLIESVLKDIGDEFGGAESSDSSEEDESVANEPRTVVHKPKFILIKLNGKYQTDDQTAIKEIGLQLDWFLYSSGISDTPIFENGSSSEIMKRIMMIIDPISETDDPILVKLKSYSMIFIIDEFDIFTNGSKQTLLYNLFDVAQSSGEQTKDHASVVILGVSCKTTVREQLEKRVKSRFSQRIIQLNKVKTVDEFLELVYEILKVDGEDEFNESIRNDTTVRKLAVENYFTIKDIRTLKGSLKSYINGHLIKPNYNNKSLVMLDSLSQLELKLLINVTKIATNEIQFDMAFEEYCKQAKQASTNFKHSLFSVGKVKTSSVTTNRDTLLVCWEKLVEKGLLTPHNGGFAADVPIDEVVNRCTRREGFEWVAHWARVT